MEMHLEDMRTLYRLLHAQQTEILHLHAKLTELANQLHRTSAADNGAATVEPCLAYQRAQEEK